MIDKNGNEQNEKPEDKKRVLYIVKSKESSGKGFETFLKNRNWEVVSNSDLKKALASLLTQPIYCALITVDHPNTKCNKLPGIIAQTIKVPVILYSEGENQNGMNALRASTHPYILYPPVSGPAIERMILKIEKDQAQTAENQNISSNSRGISGDKNVEIEKNRTAVRGQGAYSMDELVRLFEGEGQGEMKSAEARQIQVGGTNSSLDSGPIVGSHPAQESKSPDGSRNSQGGGEAVKQKSSINFTSNIAQEDLSDSDKKERGQGPDLEPNGTLGPSAMAQISQANTKKSVPTNENDTNKNAPRIRAKSNFSQEGGFSLKAARTGQIFSDSSKEQSILLRGAEHALSKSAVNRSISSLHTKKIIKCSRVSCFELNSAYFSGYVIVAFGTNRDLDADFNLSLRKYLIDYLSQNGLVVSLEALPSLRLMEVNFEDWSLQEAAFLRMSVHDDSEIAIAFFPAKEKISPLELSAESHMYKMNIEDIKKDEILEFDIYLHMPANKKYIRFAARDLFFPGYRKERLKAGGVVDIHIRKESEHDVIRYKVQNFLNDTIKAYKKKQSA